MIEIAKLKEEYFNLLFTEEVSPNHLTELIIAKLKILPKKLYRYRPANKYLRDTLTNDTAFLCPADQFNDPYDSGLTIDQNFVHLNRIKDNVLFEFCKKSHYLMPEISLDSFYSEVQSITKEVPLEYLGYILGSSLSQSDEVIADIESKINYIIEQTSDLYDNYISEMNKAFQSKVYAACFSETNDNILMWSHYAQYHQGVCIEYDFSNIDFTDRLLLTLSPVKYTNELFDMQKFSNRESIDRLTLAALSKNKCWEYESEWRLLSFLKDEQIFKLFKPTAVILGTNIKPKKTKWITEICRERSIPIKQAVMDRTKYKLHIK